MEEVVLHLQSLLEELFQYQQQHTENVFSEKKAPDKWSKKEIMGHLVDSGVYNWQRFTEITCSKSPYQVKSYPQNELVKANAYQTMETTEIWKILQVINKQIIHVIMRFDEDLLSQPIVLPNNTPSDARFLIKDYVRHFEHHVQQIIHL